MSATSQCHHPDLHFAIHHVCLGDSNTHYVELKARCNVCAVPMLFPLGLPFGASPDQITCSVDGEELRVPIRGSGEAPTGSQIGAIGRFGR